MVLKWDKRLYHEIFIATAILLLPYSLFLHTFFEEDIETIQIFGYSYYHGLGSNDMFVWYVLKKTIPILLFLIWLIKSRLWWRYFILSPILTFLFTFVNLFTFKFKSENPILYKYIVPGFVTLSGLIFILIILHVIRFYQNFDNYTIISKHPIYLKEYKVINNRIKDFLTAPKVNLENKGTFSLLHKMIYMQKLIKEKLILKDKNIDENNTFKSRIDMVFCFLLLTIPFIYFFNKTVPDGHTYRLFFITIEDFGFGDVNTFLFYIGHTLCIILPLCIWFITERSWWRYAILSPIIVSAYQIWDALQPTDIVDEIEYFKSMPYIFILVLILFGLSYVTRYKYKVLDGYDQLTLEIDQLLSYIEYNNISISKVKSNQTQLREIIKKEKTKESLTALLQLKKDLQLELHKINTVSNK